MLAAEYLAPVPEFKSLRLITTFVRLTALS